MGGILIYCVKVVCGEGGGVGGSCGVLGWGWCVDGVLWWMASEGNSCEYGPYVLCSLPTPDPCSMHVVLCARS